MQVQRVGSENRMQARYDDRDSNISWFKPEKELHIRSQHEVSVDPVPQECPLLYQKLKDLVREVANKEWPLFEVSKAGEPVCTYEDAQYTVYRESQHFQAWHQDAFEKGNDPEDARQFTVVLMLSHASNYTGGRFQAKVAKSATKRKVTQCIPLDAGDALVFPSKRLMHRVTVVKRGRGGTSMGEDLVGHQEDVGDVGLGPVSLWLLLQVLLCYIACFSVEG
ncbi:unnamed protein product [Symbiodinium natans]|uniref:Prolyl 4-hydroxylase alpha subunit Fe(2+) 2OG dioxygenase domain-containing protein n=1 Tax=Symbiodinium natans TaxID=878477 RepID=A0A812PF02_9DINO|nr:unnamed protein product [Symbiodinium natans]